VDISRASVEVKRLGISPEQFFWLMLIPTAIALWAMHRRQK